MEISFSITKKHLEKIYTWFENLSIVRVVFYIATLLAVLSTSYSFIHGYIISYGDAESHINIAKKVVSSLTPGFAQLGGIWLPLPHIFMLPFVVFDPLWRTGLAGSIVSGVAFIISGIFIYKIAYLLLKNKLAAFVSFLVFGLNPNMLYLQATPMTEPTLICFFILSSYYFIKYILDTNNLQALILAGLFGFCATLSRYDGWFLVLCEALVIILLYVPNKKLWKRMEGRTILFSTLAFFGIFLWLLWDFLILGDAFYFKDSIYSAQAQQISWLKRGELPAFHNAVMAFLYYFIDSMTNTGMTAFFMGFIGFILYLVRDANSRRFYIALILLNPFIFNVISLFFGQSVIFIPHLTPATYEWKLFNARYGILMLPFIAIFMSYLFSQGKTGIKLLITSLFIVQMGLYIVGYSPVIALADGITGLSSAIRPDAEFWMHKHYDKGLVLLDDYSRTISIIRSGIPMQDIIYVGNKPYWNDSLHEPEKYASWLVMQKNDAVWTALYANKEMRGRVYKYFQKVYTSPTILIFKRDT